MMILVINAGSSSVKFTLFRSEDLHPTASGLVERIGMAGTAVHYRSDRGDRITRSVSVGTIRHALRLISELLREPGTGAISSENDISAVGHRVVHGGEQMTASVLIDERVRSVIRSCFDLAPLHNPPNLAGIEACTEMFPGPPRRRFSTRPFTVLFQSMPISMPCLTRSMRRKRSGGTGFTARATGMSAEWHRKRSVITQQHFEWSPAIWETVAVSPLLSVGKVWIPAWASPLSRGFPWGPGAGTSIRPSCFTLSGSGGFPWSRWIPC